jgi:hypothetical protein
MKWLDVPISNRLSAKLCWPTFLPCVRNREINPPNADLRHQWKLGILPDSADRF